MLLVIIISWGWETSVNLQFACISGRATKGGSWPERVGMEALPDSNSDEFRKPLWMIGDFFISRGWLKWQALKRKKEFSVIFIEINFCVAPKSIPKWMYHTQEVWQNVYSTLWILLFSFMFMEKQQYPWGCTDSKRHNSCPKGLQCKQSYLKYFTRSKCLSVFTSLAPLCFSSF